MRKGAKTKQSIHGDNGHETKQSVRGIGIFRDFRRRRGVGIRQNLNMICLGRQVVGHALAWELVQGFLAAKFSGAERHRRHLAKVAALENSPPNNL